MAKRNWKRDPGVWICAAVLGVLLVGGIAKNGGLGGGSSDPEPDAAGAQVACEDRVKTGLKSPRSAKFSEVTAVPRGDNTWTVAGAVDSENSFGALLRGTFTCHASSDDGELWTTSRVSIN